MDDQDFILYVDRIKDIINRGGVKISALEVENVLMEHPSISRASAVAMADPVMVEKICAFVVLKPGAELSMATLSAFLESKRVTRQKWPERLEIVSELPMTPTGKVQKNLLRDRICAPAAPAATGAR
jgi:non-ribosomal peptide synthetase component E (peptide arylation enzyme)